MIDMNTTTVRALVVTLSNGGTRVRVFANGKQKTVQFSYGASDQHTQAIYDATGIHPDRLIEISRTLNGRRYRVEPRMSEAYELGVDTYDGLAARHGEHYAAHATLDMIEGEDTRALKTQYNRLTKESSSRRDAFLSILATITEGQE